MGFFGKPKKRRFLSGTSAANYARRQKRARERQNCHPVVTSTNPATESQAPSCPNRFCSDDSPGANSTPTRRSSNRIDDDEIEIRDSPCTPSPRRRIINDFLTEKHLRIAIADQFLRVHQFSAKELWTSTTTQLVNALSLPLSARRVCRRVFKKISYCVQKG